MKKFVLILIIFLPVFIYGQQWYAMDAGVTNTVGDCDVGCIINFQNKLIISGHFKTSGSTIINSVAQWDGVHWQPMGLGIWDENTSDLTGLAGRLIIYKSKLFCGGFFPGAGGSFINDATHYANSIAYWNGLDWNPISPGPMPSGVNGNTAGLGIYNDHLYMGGVFNHNFDTSGLRTANGLAEWNDTVFLPSPASLSGSISIGFSSPLDFTVHNNKLIMGGEFTSINGSPSGSFSGIAAWNDTNWTVLGSGFNRPVASLVVYNGELYAGGEFTATGDNLTTLHYVAKWDGLQWLQVGEGLNDSVFKLYVDTLQNKLYAGGTFTQTGLGVPARHIAEWTGTNWQEVGGGTNGIVGAIYSKDSNLYIGGYFTQVGNGISANHIACWGPSPLGVNEIDDRRYARLYPNPATNEVKLESKMQNAEIVIRDVLGQMVYSAKAIAASSTIDVSMLSKGVYFISLQNGKQTINKKLVKE